MATSLPKSKQWKLGTLAIKPYDVDVTNNVSIDGTLGVTGASTFTGAITKTGGERVKVSAVTAAGSSQSDAAALSEGLNVVTGADGTKGVKLPTAVAGMVVYIKGVTAGVLKVYPATGGAINAVSANGAMSFASGAIPAMLIASSETQWYTFPLVPS